VSIGGSSTYGVPLRFGYFAYPEVLQRLLDERRPFEHYEVLNAGIAAYGIMQDISALKEEILQFKPDIVTICSWFNDSASSPRWYRIPGISDREAYYKTRMLRKIQEFPPYKAIHETRLFGLARHILISLRTAFLGREQIVPESSRPRMTPEEFEWALNEIVKMGEEYNFLPVFVLEVLNRTRNLKQSTRVNKYYQTILKVAEKHDIPVVDTISAFHQRRDEWLYYDFIHPNRHGHDLIAHTIFDRLFSKEPGTRLTNFWNEKGIDWTKPQPQRVAIRRLNKADAPSGEILFKARAPFLSTQADLEVSVNGAQSTVIGPLTSEYRDFSINQSLFNATSPVSEFYFRAKLNIERNASAFKIGKGNIYSPVHIRAISGGKLYGWTSDITVQGRPYAQNRRGFNIVVVGRLSGEVKASE
ncbi:MAG: SGNH/GDSL hydrolase family protein, partial [Bdellovibrionales bacterium]|nr:SGNH/GDSL hydrolase family protein [Bdellovibrionales bacterium]